MKMFTSGLKRKGNKGMRRG